MIPSKNAVLFCLATLFIQIGCREDCFKSRNCSLDPETGTCLAAFPKFYFDKEEGRCKEFIWGGCNGVVPFDTMEACRECECNE